MRLKILKIKILNLDESMSNLQKKQKGFEEDISEIKSQIHGNKQVIESNSERLLNIGKDGLAIEERERNLDEISVVLDRKERVFRVLNEEVEDKREKTQKNI